MDCRSGVKCCADIKRRLTYPFSMAIKLYFRFTHDLSALVLALRLKNAFTDPFLSLETFARGDGCDGRNC
jgi:hypothetical protein